jgi:hypothetical protein
MSTPILPLLVIIVVFLAALFVALFVLVAAFFHVVFCHIHIRPDFLEMNHTIVFLIKEH